MLFADICSVVAVVELIAAFGTVGVGFVLLSEPLLTLLAIDPLAGATAVTLLLTVSGPVFRLGVAESVVFLISSADFLPDTGVDKAVFFITIVDFIAVESFCFVELMVRF